MAFPLIPFGELAPPRVGGVGPVVGTYRDRDRVAIYSSFGLLSWPGRALHDGHEPRHRVTLHVGDAPRAIGYLDDVRFPVTDVAFHRVEPVVAIATGCYDGEYKGELWWWNWVTGERRSLLGGSRQVERCRFEGDRIAIHARAQSGRFGAVLDPHAAHAQRLDDLEPIDPAAFGPPIAQDTPAELARLGIEPRAPIWDLAVLGDGRIVAACDDGGLEIFRATGERLARHTLDGQVVQLLPSSDQLLVNVTRLAHDSDHHISTIYALAGDRLVNWKMFPTARACSIDARGRVLARNTVAEYAPDEVLAPDGRTLLSRRLGYYDSVNHPLRIDHAPDLYFLRGQPKHRQEHKQLCRIDQNWRVDEVCDWDSEDSHLMVGSAVLVGGDLVRSYRVYNPDPTHTSMRVERMTLAGALVWRIEVGAVAAALVLWPAVNAIVFALVDTTLGIVDADTGEQHRLEPFVLDGLPTIITALMVYEETLVAGTIDGRVVMYAAR